MDEAHQEFDPASFITVGAEGPPGQRTFFLQVARGTEVLTLLIEKAQAVALAESIDRLLDGIGEPLSSTIDDADVRGSALALLQPLQPAYRVVEMGLGIDEERGCIVLIVLEAPSDEPGRGARISASYAQMRVLARRAQFVADQGRPLCTLCGHPIDADGHFCPRTNGHARPPA